MVRGAARRPRQPGPARVIAFSLITGIGEAAIGTLAAPFVRDVLGGDGRAYGLAMASQSIGGLAGGLIVTLIGHRFDPRAMTVFQQATDDSHRGRFWGTIMGIDAVAMLVGTLASGALAEHLGILPVITVPARFEPHLGRYLSSRARCTR
ncbi:hypothetical protein [Actinoplanes sp. NPDC051494]|uniref:hypothetical protein n=1 Tax=Actinoplanes sp. NPDC051494 TaxID=3363907 RepID=UPI0037B896FB